MNAPLSTTASPPQPNTSASPLRVGVGGPVGSGKTTLVEMLCKTMRERFDLVVVTNDIYTKEDQRLLTVAGALEPERIVGVETGGCPHTAIREDASINLEAIDRMLEDFPDADVVFVESGGDNLAATFSPDEAEALLKPKLVDDGKRMELRAERCKPIVDEFFAWLKTTLEERVLLPSNPFKEAAGYALAREGPLRVFLEYPDVPIDTNHLEREIRPIALGRKNWLFCWTEIGAKYVGIFQRLLVTCRLQGVDPSRTSSTCSSALRVIPPATSPA